MNVYHKTTINFHKTTMALLEFLHLKTGLSRREIIIIAMNKLAVDNRKRLPDNLKQIMYQAPNPGKENWHKFHIKLSLIEYEYFVDIRHLFRVICKVHNS